MNKKTAWKHGDWNADVYAKASNVAVFDDEDPECDSIYYTDGVIFSPCRTVNRTIPDHWRSVLLAWAIKAPLLDLRNDRRIPLPQ